MGWRDERKSRRGKKGEDSRRHSSRYTVDHDGTTKLKQAHASQPSLVSFVTRLLPCVTSFVTSMRDYFHVRILRRAHRTTTRDHFYVRRRRVVVATVQSSVCIFCFALLC